MAQFLRALSKLFILFSNLFSFVKHLSVLLHLMVLGGEALLISKVYASLNSGFTKLVRTMLSLKTVIYLFNLNSVRTKTLNS